MNKVLKFILLLLLINACVYAPKTDWRPHKANRHPKKHKNYSVDREDNIQK